MEENKISIFREQIEEDIKSLQEDLSWNENTKDNPAYTFNYWVLINMYHLDQEICSSYITEYKDKGIDCYAHYEENKELYIIQNKYYSETTELNHSDISDFLTRPIASLEGGSYKNKDLQKAYNTAKEDKDYSIFLHFYLTNNNKSQDVINIIKNYNRENDNCFVELFLLDDIEKKYYGPTYQEKSTLNAVFNFNRKSSVLKILKQHHLNIMAEAYYVMAKIIDVYHLLKQAEDEKYPLFEENIREYLGGTSGINKAIIKTLKDEKKRDNFFYYNNGITIICDEVKDITSKKVEIIKPQIVNGCQTVNSIAKVLDAEDNKKDFENVYVMVKILVTKKEDSHKEEGGKFYEEIVRYTNSQNAINEKMFAATRQSFSKIQNNLEKKGFLLLVKQSDKHTFKKEYDAKEKKENKGKLLEKANKQSENFYKFNSIPSVSIPLVLLLQIIGAFKENAYFAYTKKSSLLKPSSKYYEDFSSKIHEFFTTDGMVKLILLYKKAKLDQKKSESKKFPSPWHVLNFLGYYLIEKEIKQKEFLKKITVEQLSIIYDFFKKLPEEYYNKYKEKKGNDKFGYNDFIKKQIDKKMMKEALDDELKGLKKHNESKYNEFIKVFEDVKKI